MKEAIYVVEYTNIPTGIDALDQMIKRAEVTILHARPICIGKYLIVLGGSVDSVREAQRVVQTLCTDNLLSQYLLTNAHHEILSYFNQISVYKNEISMSEAVGIFEVKNSSNGFRCLDAALKSGNVKLGHIWLGHFLGGKFCYLLIGSVEDVKMALKAAECNLEEGCLVESKLIPSPDSKTLGHLINDITM